MAEQLGLDQAVGNGAAVHGHELPPHPHAVGMDRPGNQLLARAALAGDEHVAFTRCGMAHDAEGFADLGAVADDALEGIAGLDLGPKNQVLPFEPALLQRPPDRHPHLIGRERLGDVIVDALFHRIDRGRNGAEGGDDDEDAVRRRRP